MAFRQISLVVLATILSTGSARAQHFPPADDLTMLLRFVVEDGGLPGAAMGVLDADGTVSVVVYGSAGEGAPPLGPRSTFEIGSITKTFTATLLADMVLRGEVRLEDPLSLYLPANVRVPTAPGRPITLLDLATHRSGLPNTPEEMQVGPVIPEDEYSHEDAYEFLRGYELPYPPGTRQEYSNFGYALLGHALANAAGESYQTLVRSRILEPLNMEDTGFSQDTTGTTWTRGSRYGHPVRYRPDWSFVAGAGGLYSSATDLLLYMRAHLSPAESRLQEAMRMAYEIRFPEGPPGSGLGLAWQVSALPNEAPIVSHSGGTSGYRSQLAFMPDRGIGTVLLTNSAQFEDNLGMVLLLPDPPPADWRAAPPPATDLRRYVGEYAATRGDARFRIQLEDGGFLTYRPGDQPRTPLFHRGDSTFYLLRAPITVRFSEGADGRMEMEMAIDEREPSQQRVIQRAVR